jgi:hypothetical protein
MITGTSSAVNRTSVSQKLTPELLAWRNALRVFSTYRSVPPRCATGDGRDARGRGVHRGARGGEHERDDRGRDQ